MWKSVSLCRMRWLQFTLGLAAWPDIGIVEVEAVISHQEDLEHQAKFKYE